MRRLLALFIVPLLATCGGVVSMRNRLRNGLGLGLLLALLPGCLEGSGPRTTTETHWLQGCQTDADCRLQRDYACICGVCTAICSPSASCLQRLHADDLERYQVTPDGVTCAAPERLQRDDACAPGDLAQPGVCLPTCPASDTQCEGPADSPYEADLVCGVDAVCEAPSVPFGPATPSGGDNNNRPDEAEPLEILEATPDWVWNHWLFPTLPVEGSAAGRLDPTESPGTGGDRDYYRFELTDEAWVVVATSANPGSVGGQLNTVLTLYDAAGTQLAANDDAVGTRSSSGWRQDSELVVRLPAGRYTIEVADSADLRGLSFVDEHGDYRVGVGRLEGDAANLTLEGEGEVTDLPIPTRFEPHLLLGELDGTEDVDVFRIPSVPRCQVAARRMPPGPEGHGGPPVRIWLTLEGSDAIVARVDGERDELAIPAAPGTYLLQVALDGEVPSGLAYYVIKHERTQERASLEDTGGEPANDTIDGADELAHGSPFVVWLEEGDVDYVAFEVGAGNAPGGLECRSWLDGSGVLDLSLQARDSQDQPFEDGLGEGLAGGAYLFGQTPVASGRYYVRLESGGHDPAVMGSFVRCEW